MVQKATKTKKAPNGVRVQRRKLKDYVLDPHNSNRGTQRGESMLETSLEMFGPARSGVVDQDGVIRAGNHTAQQLMDAGIEDVIEVETDGDAWVVVKRNDFDASKGQQYAVADNQVAAKNLDWDGVVLSEIAETHDLSAFFKPEELALLKVVSGDTTDYFDSTKLPDASVGNVDTAYLIYLCMPNAELFYEVMELLGGRTEFRQNMRMAKIDCVERIVEWRQRFHETGA